MSTCCIATTSIAEACALPEQEMKPTASNPCPICGRPGRSVDIGTVKALLAVSLQHVQAHRYCFCRTPTCPIVYYATDGSEQYRQDELRERVHQKQLEADDVLVCYCFRYTPAMIRTELQETGESTVVDAISAGIKAGQCACEIRNPQGSCCLGNVLAAVKRIQAALQSERTSG